MIRETFQYVKETGSEVKVTQSCSTLWDSMDYTVHGILQARILEWAALPFSRGSSWPRNWTQVSCIADGFFTNWAIREAHVSRRWLQKKVWGTELHFKGKGNKSDLQVAVYEWTNKIRDTESDKKFCGKWTPRKVFCIWYKFSWDIEQPLVTDCKFLYLLSDLFYIYLWNLSLLLWLNE